MKYNRQKTTSALAEKQIMKSAPQMISSFAKAIGQDLERTQKFVSQQMEKDSTNTITSQQNISPR